MLGELVGCVLPLDQQRELLLEEGVGRRVQLGVPGEGDLVAEVVDLPECLGVEGCCGVRDHRLDARDGREVPGLGELRGVPLEHELEEVLDHVVVLVLADAGADAGDHGVVVGVGDGVGCHGQGEVVDVVAHVGGQVCARQGRQLPGADLVEAALPLVNRSRASV